VVSAFDETLGGFETWATAEGRALHGDPYADLSQLEMIFDLARDYEGATDPVSVDYEHLLMSVYPRKITVLEREDANRAINAMRDLAAYLGETNDRCARQISTTLDEIEPDFADAVMNPANWGMATSLMHAMHRDGVDAGDEQAVQRWIANYNAGLTNGISANDISTPLAWEDTDPADLVELPDTMSPLRLPCESELAEQARTAPLLVELHDLADRVRAGSVDPAEVDDVVLPLALHAELVARDGDVLVPGDDAGWLDDLTDDFDALDAWEYIFGSVIDMDIPDSAVLVTKLFVERRNGLPVGPRDIAGLERLDAATVTDGVARLTPLGLYAVFTRLDDSGTQVPFLPSPEKMQADDIVDARCYESDDEFREELARWKERVSGDQAARELLKVAAAGTPPIRTVAMQIMTAFGPEAELAWREALARRELSCYAKPALARLGGFEPGDLPEELRISRTDTAWLIADTFAPFTEIPLASTKAPLDLEELGTGIQEILDVMWRLDHPYAEAVLTLIGNHAENKQTAKAARKAAYKASTRRSSKSR